MTESVIDFPKNTLCPDIWEIVVDISGTKEIWQLRQDVKDKLSVLIDAILSKVNIADISKFNIHITGSITSNSYTENADIDLHFQFIESFAIREFSEITQERFKHAADEIKQNQPDLFMIGKHPIEVYFQPNKFQDFMSVGCYDFKQSMWLVGPDFTDPSFNPYSEYYKEIQDKSNQLASQIRNKIFSIYELAVVIKKNAGTEFEQQLYPILAERLNDAKNLYEQIREMRKVYSSPTSKEEALTFRASRKWKIADASFKLFDKYGYLAILKSFIEVFDSIEHDISLLQMSAEYILKTVKKYINNADKLSEQELYETEQIDEGLLNNLAIAALLAIPGILPETALAAELKKVPEQQMYMTSKPVQTAIDNATTQNKMIGNFSYRNSINILQWVYYTEAANQGLEGRKAIFSVLWNRAGGKPEKLVPKAIQSGLNSDGVRIYQFSEWMPGNNWGLVAPKTDKDWKYKVPKDITNPNVQKIWKEAEEYAIQMLNGKWKSNIGKCNLIASDNDSEEAKRTWGKDCSYKIGNHRFGYDPYQDGFKTKAKSLSKSTYTIAKGDTGITIAKKLNKNFKDIAAKNPTVNWNKLKVGQKIFI